MTGLVISNYLYYSKKRTYISNTDGVRISILIAFILENIKCFQPFSPKETPTSFYVLRSVLVEQWMGWVEDCNSDNMSLLHVQCCFNIRRTISIFATSAKIYKSAIFSLSPMLQSKSVETEVNVYEEVRGNDRIEEVLKQFKIKV